MEEQQSRYNTARSSMDAIDAQNRFQELAAMYDEIAQMGKVMDLICTRIYVPGKTLAECDKNVGEVINSLDKYKAGVCLYETKQDWLAIFRPQSKQRDTIYKKELQPVPSETFAAGNPFHFSKLIDPNGFYWGETDTGGNVIFDLFYNDGFSRLSYNALFFGIMGSGKSTSMKKLIDDRAARGDKIRIFDVTGEYRELTLQRGGRIVSFDGSGGEMINILQILPAAETDQLSYVQHLAKLATIYSCLRPEGDEIETQDFEAALRRLYEEWGIVSSDGEIRISLSDYDAGNFPILSDLHSTLKKIKKEMEAENNLSGSYERIVNITSVIENCCTSYRDIFNGYTSIGNIFSEQILCFDLRNLLAMKESIFNAQMTNLLGMSWSDAVLSGAKYKTLVENKEITTDEVIHTVFICDEIHRWLNPQKKELVLMVTRFEREARKWFCGIVLATQSLSDIVPDHISSEELQNMRNLFELSVYRFVMLQTDSVKHKYREVFGDSFSDWEINQIPTLSQGETILSILGTGNFKFHISVPEKSLSYYKGGV